MKRRDDLPSQPLGDRIREEVAGNDTAAHSDLDRTDRLFPRLDNGEEAIHPRLQAHVGDRGLGVDLDALDAPRPCLKPGRGSLDRKPVEPAQYACGEARRSGVSFDLGEQCAQPRVELRAQPLSPSARPTLARRQRADEQSVREAVRVEDRKSVV